MSLIEEIENANKQIKEMIDAVSKLPRLQHSMMDELVCEAEASLHQAQQKMETVLAEMQNQLSW